MSFSGKAVQLKDLGDGFRELVFDLQGESTNRFNAFTLGELAQAVDALSKEKGVRGLLISSGKDAFIVGADITEFTGHFAQSDAQLEKWMLEAHHTFSRVDDLPYPTVCLISGFALGGGFEMALTAHFRVATASAKIGLPETKLGIFPGWGGTVRFSRLVGADNAIEWIASGNQYKAADALKLGAIDAVVNDAAQLREVGMRMLHDAASEALDWKSRHALKSAPIPLSQIESAMTFEGTRAFVAGQAGPNYPAPVAAIDAMAAGARLSRDEAIALEVKGFVKVAKTPQAAALIGVFLADQAVKKTAKQIAKGARPIKSGAVLGAGIMGGGIAYQSAYSKIPVVMKDIRTEALDLGMREASKNLERRVDKGQMKSAEMSAVLTRIRPALSYDELKDTDIVVEAVVEKESVKQAVFADLEKTLRPDAIICSNTSTISITRLAKSLKRPENFVGMHFFNPVHKMPLVEIIRGEKSSDEAVATAVAYANVMGKTAVVVNDCPGFFINRVLFPYVWGFQMLVRDGVEFERLDKVMEKFGWPMGPTYLMDVVGVDTAYHCLGVMAEGFPDRMKYDFTDVITLLYKNQRFGQKNGKGFFTYTNDPKGKPIKSLDPAVFELLGPAMKSKGNSSITDEDIVHRMMLPMIFECSRTLEDKIIGTVAEVDLSLLYGLGFPPFRGGALRYADSLGAKKLVELGEKFKDLGKLYEPTAQIRKQAETGKGFYA